FQSYHATDEDPHDPKSVGEYHLGSPCPYTDRASNANRRVISLQAGKALHRQSSQFSSAGGSAPYYGKPGRLPTVHTPIQSSIVGINREGRKKGLSTLKVVARIPHTLAARPPAVTGMLLQVYFLPSPSPPSIIRSRALVLRTSPTSSSATYHRANSSHVLLSHPNNCRGSTTRSQEDPARGHIPPSARHPGSLCFSLSPPPFPPSIFSSDGFLFPLFPPTFRNSIAASAVCAFNLSAVTQAFNGPFKYQENSRSAWLPYPNPNPDFQCGTIDSGTYVNLTERNLQDAQKFLLMHEVVQPVVPVPYFMEDNVRFSHVAVDVVQGKDMLFHIIYLATDYGTIRKVLSPLNQSTGSCLLEEIELFPPRKRQPIRSLLILHSRSELYVGVRDQVIKIPLKRCSYHKSREACVGARDPYCGWDLLLKKCTTLEESVRMSQWEQSITKCPVLAERRPFRLTAAEFNYQREHGRHVAPASARAADDEAVSSPRVRNVTIDGGFGAWSGWSMCSHTDGGSAGACLCRTRACDHPAPQCGGQHCLGISVEVANCSRNGAWTPWTLWSPCSTSCGIGFQVRQRSCSNPTPRHGGRVCVGQNREERYCNEHLPCPPHVYWSAWSAWDRCNVPCGGGVQSRRRTCENGNDCPGCGQLGDDLRLSERAMLEMVLIVSGEGT
ncbi:unnamed protein product, partial [Pleuronectes platessa]